MHSALILDQSYKADITRGAKVVTSKKPKESTARPLSEGFHAPLCLPGGEVVGCLNQRVDYSGLAD